MVLRFKTNILGNMKLMFLFFWMFAIISIAQSQEDLFMHWSFDDSKDLQFRYGQRARRGGVLKVTSEEVAGENYNILGLAKYTPGVSGSAMKFDGFSSYVRGPAEAQRGRGEEIESLAGKTIKAERRGEELTLVFKEKGVVRISGGEAGEGVDARYEQVGTTVNMSVGRSRLKAKYDGKAFKIVETEIPKEISIEAWIALGSYPWNWVPILTVGKYKITGFYLGVDGRGRVGFHMSDATSVWHECNSALDPQTHLGLELKKWHHIVATYSPEEGSAVYINGELAGTYKNFQFDYGIAYSSMEEGYRIGKNQVDLAPSEPIRDWATYPSRYTFDGIIDEIKIHKGAKSAQEVAALYKSVTPQNEPDLPPRHFPTVKSSGRFSANYTRLQFYPEWDALWPVGDYMDVVVQFDELPTKVMFWRGTRYSACLVSENGKWMADQSRETGNNWFLAQGAREEMPTGCIEHMSDTQCRSSRVAIIENNDARIMVNWRYLQMDVKFRQKDVPNETGFGEWGNEYYYIYPDGVTARKVLPGYGGWQETIFLNEPGTRPEDNVELEACTLVNMDGESKDYSWEHGYPVFDLENAVIQMTNFKSKFKPHMIFREGGGFSVFNLEARPEYSHFPWWNHWPVAQTYSDGRSANAPDRTAHSSLSWGNPNGEAALYGMTNQPAEALVDLARSWNYPPQLTVQGSAYESAGYDYTQRAYILNTKQKGAPLQLEFAASEKSPLSNMALVINNFGDSAIALKIDGRAIPRGKDFRYGIEYDVEGNAQLIVFIKKKAKKNTSITLTPVQLSQKF
jgi:hypothetical protein